MADVYGVNTTKVNAGTKDGNWVDQGLIKSSVKVMSDVYEASALADGSTIGMANLPAGAVVQAVVVSFDALGAGVTVEVGDANTSDLYLSATVATNAGSALGDKVDGVSYVIGTNDGDDEILITTGVGASTGTIKLLVLYTN